VTYGIALLLRFFSLLILVTHSPQLCPLYIPALVSPHLHSIYTVYLNSLPFSSAIPTILNGGNHTTGFADSALTVAAHDACLDVSKALAATGVRVLTDDSFFGKVCFNR
jgi:hypothetical protein